MRVPLSVLVGTGLFSFLGCGGGGDGYGGGGPPTQPVLPAVASEIVAASGGGGDAPWGTALATPMVAKVTTSTGAPVAGVTVNFAVSAGGGSVSPATAVTDGSGNAQTTLTLGPQAGENVVTASTSSLPGKSATFSAQAKMRFTGLATGGSHACVIAATNATESSVYCWGGNTFGNLGNGGTVHSPLPQRVTGLPNGQIAQLTAGAAHTCALQVNGGLYCWGFNASGQLGDGTTTMRTAPVLVSNSVGRYNSVAAGGVHTCGRLANGGVECWGDNVVGQIGDGTTTRRLTPTAVLSSGISLSELGAGAQHTCAVGADSELYCWGRGDRGQLGIGSAPQNASFSRVSRPAGVTLRTPVGGENFTCAMGSNDRVYCWGENNVGQLGDGTTTGRLTPVAVSAVTPLVKLGSRLGGGHTCALTAAQAVYCWGLNERGQLGDGTNAHRSFPTAVVAGSAKFTSVSPGTEYTCAATTDYRVMCWGSNTLGQLGDGTTTHRTAPVSVVVP